MSVARDASALRRPAFAGVVAAACTAVVLSGCTSNAEPAPLPKPSSSPSASPSPSATPPSLPPEAEGTSPQAAKAFARHYFDVINYAARTGDTQDLRKLGTPGCVSCEAIASNIEKIYNAGGHIESENWELQSIAVLKASDGRAVLSLGSLIHREVIVTAGAERESKPGGKQPITMFARLGAGGPRVTKLDFVT